MIVTRKRQARKVIDINEASDGVKYFLRLFVAGIMPNSVVAIKNIKEICEHHFKGNFKLQIIDIYQQPELAITEQIVVLPVLIIKSAIPEIRVIGNLSDRGKVIDIINSH